MPGSENSTFHPERSFMEEAIRQARFAQKEGDYAVGAALIHNNKIIAACSNRSKRDENPIAHAETLAIIEGCKIFKNRHLPNCILYVTHEPCPMCSAVAVWTKLKGIVYGAKIEDMRNYRAANGNINYQWRTIKVSCKEIIEKSTEKIEIVSDFMRDKCIELFHN